MCVCVCVCAGIHTVAVDEVSQVEIKFSNRHVDMMRIHTQRRMHAVGRLLQSLSVSAFQRNGTEQYHHHQVQPPDLVRLAQTVNASHLSLLIGVAADAGRVPMPGCDAVDKVLAAVLGDVLA